MVVDIGVEVVAEEEVQEDGVEEVVVAAEADTASQSILKNWKRVLILRHVRISNTSIWLATTRTMLSQDRGGIRARVARAGMR
jgi:hypothetical protein